MVYIYQHQEFNIGTILNHRFHSNFINFSTHIPFLLQDPIHNTKLHLVFIVALDALQSVSYCFLLVLHDLGTFEGQAFYRLSLKMGTYKQWDSIQS